MRLRDRPHAPPDGRKFRTFHPPVSTRPERMHKLICRHHSHQNPHQHFVIPLNHKAQSLDAASCECSTSARETCPIHSLRVTGAFPATSVLVSKFPPFRSQNCSLMAMLVSGVRTPYKGGF